MRTFETYFKVLCIMSLAFLLVKCKAFDPKETEPAITPTVEYVQEWPKDEYTDALFKAIETNKPALLAKANPADASFYCPKFGGINEAEKKQFWLTFFGAMSYRESGYKPETKYTESFKDSAGKFVVSRGLFQISPESANQRAYGCGVKADGSDLHDPEKNITCAVKIFGHWFVKDGYIGQSVNGSHLGGARYWSVLRNASSSQAYIQKKTKALRFCN